ncbi:MULTISPECIES: flagellar hook-basal body complex protein FliE [Bacillaceae]|uniref:flagellar hook-basal body complex protein FliE n=1 Tax=Bacillaceae TaxID=186817 RepID=UPI000B9C0BD7|nr:flagellar hook-basal body complex protein FliE [Bacillus infantis]MCK6206196.1 flagellar hook-basal body complex protein FliE [Bacillus infantis]MDW2876947.1 flagellar hook-basal body complex protein FliE [Bacillus infantis]OXT18660.1 flagellar hook-basal body complex protein FliE [Bacillus sp. OG2]
MNGISFQPVSKIFQQGSIKETAMKTPAESQKSFADFLKASINEVNGAQQESDLMTQKLANGEKIELHDVMIASQKASITMQAAMEVRNKVIEAYQETMRMQV